MNMLLEYAFYLSAAAPLGFATLAFFAS